MGLGLRPLSQSSPWESGERSGAWSLGMATRGRVDRVNHPRTGGGREPSGSLVRVEERGMAPEGVRCQIRNIKRHY